MSYALKNSRMELAEQARNVYAVVVETGTPYEEILKPQFWAHVASKLKTRDRIEVESEEGDYFAELRVTYSGNNTVRVRELYFVKYEQDDMQEEQSDFSIKWSGPIARWRITRKSDGAVLVEGKEVETREMAEDWLRNYRKALAA